MSCIASINIFTYFASRANGNLVFFSTAIFIIICITTIYIVLDGTVTNLYIIFLAACVTFTTIYYTVYFAIIFNNNMVFYSFCSSGATTTYNISQTITANRYSILSDIAIPRICTTYAASCSSTGNSNIVLKDFRWRHLCIIIATVNIIISTRIKCNISTGWHMSLAIITIIIICPSTRHYQYTGAQQTAQNTAKFSLHLFFFHFCQKLHIKSLLLIKMEPLY